MNEIVPDVFTWSRWSEPHGYDFNGYLVRHADANLCIDPVQPQDDVLSRIEQLGAAALPALSSPTAIIRAPRLSCASARAHRC